MKHVKEVLFRFTRCLGRMSVGQLVTWSLACLIISALSVWGPSCAAGRVDEVKRTAPAYLLSQGFEVVGYDGYQWAGSCGSWGGVVYYRVVRVGDPSRHLFELGVSRWGDELHIWDTKCLDCFPNKKW